MCEYSRLLFAFAFNPALVRRVSYPTWGRQFHPSVEGFRAIIQLVHAQAGRSLQPSFGIHFHLPPRQNGEAAARWRISSSSIPRSDGSRGWLRAGMTMLTSPRLSA
jgi:hypothetical protein